MVRAGYALLPTLSSRCAMLVCAVPSQLERTSLSTTLRARAVALPTAESVIKAQTPRSFPMLSRVVPRGAARVVAAAFLALFARQRPRF